MRTIDADALIKLLEDCSSDVRNIHELEMNALCFALLKSEANTPTIDALPVVRCRDCRHYRCQPSSVNNNAVVVWCDKHNDRNDRINLAALDDDWFCADGERRIDKGNEGAKLHDQKGSAVAGRFSGERHL